MIIYYGILWPWLIFAILHAILAHARESAMNRSIEHVLITSAAYLIIMVTSYAISPDLVLY